MTWDPYTIITIRILVIIHTVETAEAFMGIVIRLGIITRTLHMVINTHNIIISRAMATVDTLGTVGTDTVDAVGTDTVGAVDTDTADVVGMVMADAACTDTAVGTDWE